MRPAQSASRRGAATLQEMKAPHFKKNGEERSRAAESQGEYSVACPGVGEGHATQLNIPIFCVVIDERVQLNTLNAQFSLPEAAHSESDGHLCWTTQGFYFILHSSQQ